MPVTVKEPFPISQVANRYLLFDIDFIAHCRRLHNICGVLIGSIPNLSQQNVFLGIPLELMPEEARVLVEKGAAYIVNDAEEHKKGFLEMSREDRLKYLAEMDRRGEEAAKKVAKEAEIRQEKALAELGLKKEDIAKKRAKKGETSKAREDSPLAEINLGLIMKGCTFTPLPTAASELFSADATTKPASRKTAKTLTLPKIFVTPTTSRPALPNPSPDPSRPLPAVPKSYPLFRFLHQKGYFHMPGLRFGCHYNVYPGDPLRYHSHFAATGFGWNEEFELLDVVGGGRLGTGTKKAYMVGGADEGEEVRAFSIEWAVI